MFLRGITIGGWERMTLDEILSLVFSSLNMAFIHENALGVPLPTFKLTILAQSG
jgi:hypothetical protein